MSDSTTTTIETGQKHPYKRQKPSDGDDSKLVIGTHSGTFQADEALGVWLLRQLPTYRNSKVVRSRDPAVLGELDIVIDVGGTYDHSKKRYDHHQRDYDERFDQGRRVSVESTLGTTISTTRPRVSKLSASGLVYRHYGREVLKQFYPQLDGQELEWVYNKIYDTFMESVDSVDTGVEPIVASDGITAVDTSIAQLAYKDTTGLSSRVARLNPRWNEKVDEVLGTSEPPNPDDRFEMASALCGKDFTEALISLVEGHMPARSHVERSILQRHTVDSSGEIILLQSDEGGFGGLPWRDHVYEMEKIHEVKPLIKYVLYTDDTGMWRIQAVTREGARFDNRLSLPEAWRGVRDADLEKVCGIQGATFCHAAGFIGGNKTYEGVLQMARAALENKE